GRRAVRIHIEEFSRPNPGFRRDDVIVHDQNIRDLLDVLGVRHSPVDPARNRPLGDTQAARELTLVEAAVAQLGFQPCPEAASMPIGITTTHTVIMLDRYASRHYNRVMRNNTERYTGTKIGMVLREQG